MSTPWYIDPDRLHLEIRDDSVNVDAINLYTNQLTRLLADPNNARKQVINRFVETGPQLINEINSFDPDLVIDLGCGINPYKNIINNIVGLDITPHQDVDYNYDFCATPFKDNVADVILLYNGYAYHPKNRAVFNEIKRIAKPGAKVYCRVSNVVFVKNELRRQKSKGIAKPDRKINNKTYDYCRAHVDHISNKYGFSFLRPPQIATWINENDRGLYFPHTSEFIQSPRRTRSRDQMHWKRIRWVWTWQVNK